MKKFLIILIAVIAVVTLALAGTGCKTTTTAETTVAETTVAATTAAETTAVEGSTEGVVAEKILKFIYVTHAPNINVFQTMYGAAKDAAALVGNVEIEFTGPDTVGDVDAQKNILEISVDKKPDALMTTTNNPDAYDEIINKAVDQGIPVYTFNIDNPDTKRFAYVGQEFISAGNSFAEQGIKLLKEKFPNEKKYKVALFVGEAGNYALELRLQGTRQILDADPSIEVIDVFITSWDQNEAYNVITDVFQKYPDLKGAFGMDAYSEYIGKYIHDSSMQGKVVVGGFDITDQAKEYIKEDAMQFLVGQNTYMQGFMPTILAYEYVAKGKQSPRLVDTGAPVVTIENVEFADKLS
ncbi:MAG: substrate-binding domain-containing protein [Actinobacteria bacterium]|nr:substrate-binding domain-containing protein [Actinomycetota bacterium]